MRGIALIGISLLLTGCGEDAGMDPPPTPVPSAITALSGGGQGGIVGQSLLQPLVVRVTTAPGSVVSGVSVTWAVTAGGGTLSSSSTTTDAQGQASVTWTLGTVVGTDNNTATASVTGLSGSPVTFMASATAGAASTLALVSGDNQTGTAWDVLAQPLVVVAQDQFNNAVSGVTVTWAVTGGGGSLSSSGVTTDAQGQATVTWTLGPAAGTDNNIATASVTGLAGSPVTFTASASHGNQDFSGIYTVHSMSQGTAASVTVLPGVTGTFSMTATTYHVEINVPVYNVSIIDNGTYTAMGTATSGEFTQISTDVAGFQYEGTYAWDAATNRLTLDTTAGAVRTVLVLQKT